MDYNLELQNVCKSYPEFSLKNITFALPKGAIMGLIGVNGAGKSTTMKCILNMLRLDSGSIKLLGQDPQKDEDIRQEIGVVFDENCFPQNFTAKKVDAVMRSIYKNWDTTVFYGYLERFNISPTKTIKALSRGMKMKLNIAVALSHQARLLILDEPTSGLDPIVRNELLDIFLEFIQDEENSVLVSSHITGDLEKIADYITFIHNGQVVFSDSKDELIYQYGVIKGSRQQIENVDPSYLMAVRQNRFDTEALICNKDQFALQYPDIIMDHATLEDFMLFLTQK